MPIAMPGRSKPATTCATFYNVYHLLNHANLFGGDYVRQGQVDIERVLAEIR